MNGVHDMGGMTCFGPVEPEKNEPVFHSEWERRVFALSMLAMSKLDTLDAFRHASERMNPVQYLSSSYYEHWLHSLETLAVERGILTDQELRSGIVKETIGQVEPPLPPEAVPAVVSTGAPVNRAEGRLTALYKVGQAVRARNMNPTGHTRLPRYVRGKTGVIDGVHGTFVYPDTNAHQQGEQPQPLYSVRFSASELWGTTAPEADSLYIDLWEDYLEAA